MDRNFCNFEQNFTLRSISNCQLCLSYTNAPSERVFPVSQHRHLKKYAKEIPGWKAMLHMKCNFPDIYAAYQDILMWNENMLRRLILKNVYQNKISESVKHTVVFPSTGSAE